MAALVVLALVLLASVTVFRNAVWAIGLATAVPIIVVGAVLAGTKLLDRAAGKSTAPGRAAAFVRTELKHIRGGLHVFSRPRDAFHASAAQLAAWSLQLAACAALLSAFGIATPSRLGAAAAVLAATNVAAVSRSHRETSASFRPPCRRSRRLRRQRWSGARMGSRCTPRTDHRNRARTAGSTRGGRETTRPTMSTPASNPIWLIAGEIAMSTCNPPSSSSRTPRRSRRLYTLPSTSARAQPVSG